MTLSTGALAQSLSTVRPASAVAARKPSLPAATLDRAAAGAKYHRLSQDRTTPSLRAAATLKARQALLPKERGQAEFEPAAAATTEPTPILGDVDGDGQVTAKDPIALLNYLFSGAEEPVGLENSDVNGDGKVNLADAVTLTQMLPS